MTIFLPCNFHLATPSVHLGEDILLSVPIHQVLGLCVHGWLGRLVFSPSRCLSLPASRRFFCRKFSFTSRTFYLCPLKFQNDFVGVHAFMLFF